MKKLLTAIFACVACVALAQEKTASLAEARAKIGDVIAKPASMTAVIGQLSAADQKAYLAEVNAAISKMPGSAEEKTAKFLDVNTAALKGARKGNLTELIAEVFATVSVESLTVINEHFASQLFNRSANAARVYTDRQFEDISKMLFNKIQERNVTADEGPERNTFAILMLLRASNGGPADLRDTLVSEIHDADTRKIAQSEWISPAMGIGQEKTYDPILGSADAGIAPAPEVVIEIATPMGRDALLADIATENKIDNPGFTFATVVTSTFTDTDTENASINRVPRTDDPTLPYHPSYDRGEAEGYNGQTTGAKKD